MKFCCVGDNCIDYYVNEDIAKPGGNPVNVAVYIKQMGGDSSYVGAVGNDEFGKILVIKNGLFIYKTVHFLLFFITIFFKFYFPVFCTFIINFSHIL